VRPDGGDEDHLRELLPVGDPCGDLLITDEVAVSESVPGTRSLTADCRLDRMPLKLTTLRSGVSRSTGSQTV
jgi:hypothetical protein